MSDDVIKPVTKSPRLNATSPTEENVVEDDDIDRLSFLPNHITHHILSLLSIGDLAKLSLTSKMFEKLCLSVPSLIINDSRLNFLNPPVQRIQFLDFLVRFMRNHRGAKLTKLTIGWHSKKLTYNEKYRMMWLLNHAMECHVNELSLALNLGSGVFLLPSDVFWCKSLKYLKVSMWKGRLDLPTPCGVSYIKRLHISSTEMVEGSLGEWISYVCKFIEELRFEDVSGMKILKISSPSLQSITIKNSSFEYLDISARLLQKLDLIGAFYGASSRSLSLNAPNLVDLQWTGVFTEHYFAEKLSSLQSAHLSLWRYEQKNLNLSGLLPSIAQVPHLDISWYTIKPLYEQGCLPFLFDDLQTLHLTLTIRSNSTDVIVPETLASFLQGLPCNLKKLYITQSSLPENFWQSNNFLFVRGLEEMDINLVGSKSEEELLEYFLENAKELKKFTVKVGSSIPTNIAAKLMTAAVARGSGFRIEKTGFRLERRKMILDVNQV